MYPNHDAEGGGHRTRVDPVVEVRIPSQDELGDSREPTVARVVQVRLLREKLGALNPAQQQYAGSGRFCPVQLDP